MYEPCRLRTAQEPVNGQGSLLAPRVLHLYPSLASLPQAFDGSLTVHLQPRLYTGHLFGEECAKFALSALECARDCAESCRGDAEMAPGSSSALAAAAEAERAI